MSGNMYSTSDTYQLRAERAEKNARLFSKFQKPRRRVTFSAIVTSVLGIFG